MHRLSLTNRRSLRILFWTAVFSSGSARAADGPDGSRLGALPIFDDGLARIDYYDAVREIYGKPRRYTRVQILIREYFDAAAGVKTEQIDAAGVIPVLKLLISEQIPTENYNYRLLTVLHVDRRDLRPVKLVTSSQEWCGATFRHLRWKPAGLTYRSFSYFEHEADRTYSLPRKVVPVESVFLLGPELAARLVADAQAERKLEQPLSLPPLHGNHQVAPDTQPLRLRALETTDLTTPAGAFKVWRIEVRRGADAGTLWVQRDVPHRVVRYELPGIGQGVLRYSERRAYWDRKWSSGFYAPGQAP